MPRKGSPPTREVDPDPIYESRLVTKFINCMMEGGKKSIAERNFYEALREIEKKTGQDPLETFQKAVDNVRPKLEVRSRRVGGATYQVPMEMRPARRTTLAIRWIIQNARSRGERSIKGKLVGELLDAVNNQGGAVKKKQDTHRMAEANKAFAHYRW
jgi:small subunit ribosomal protein S7